MKITLLSILCILAFSAFSQGEGMECIKTDGDCCVFAKSITSDASGNQYVTGWFNSTSIALGVGSLKYMAKSEGGNMSIIKYDRDGKAVWVRGAGSTEDIPTLASVTDNEGNSYVTGMLGAPCDLDLNISKKNIPDYNNNSEMTVLKYSTTGDILWLKKEGINKRSTSIAIDKKKNIYVSGYFTGPFASFGALTLKNMDFGEKTFFIVKYDLYGNVVWARNTTGTGAFEPSSMATDASGNIIVTGAFAGPAKFQTIPLTNPHEFNDIFIVKYDSTGNVKWAKSDGGIFSDCSTSLALDQHGNSYISGYFSGPSMRFGEITLTNKKAESTKDDFNIFIVKYDSKGRVLWAKNAENNGRGFPEKPTVTSDKAGNCYLGGNFEGGSFGFGGKELKTTCTSPCNFIVKLDNAGKVIWLKNIGQNECNALASFYVDPKQNCHVIIGSPQRFRMFAFNAH